MSVNSSQIKMKDVAKHANVSVATVSHVINGFKSVSPRTKEIVENSIRELGYTPNIMARNLKMGKTGTIGFVAPDVGNPFFSNLIKVTDEIMEKNGYNMMLFNTNESMKSEKKQLLLQAQGIVDGFILCSTAKNYSEIQDIIPKGIPVVYLDRVFDNAEGDCISCDSREAMRQAVDLLVTHGHKKIGMLTGLEGISTTNERMESFRMAMETHKIYNPELILDGTYLTNLNSCNLVKLIGMGCTALVLSSGMMAIDALNVLRVKKITPFKDIELVGFKDSVLNQYGYHNMHVISQPIRQMGEKASELLLERIKGLDKDCEYIKLPAEFRENRLDTE